ncbi:PepSY-associated TM helix domain-containing protein [Roseivirga echinicomitans]|uniref:Peptidase n=1 Tax=Roseivirga echinicomitans TaxID=296218 RepID=A0A150XVZ0_9BACT|nr:PepSY-associated TM helix domain-containing protein [Roseivirga echinicomitans]KYG82795.1 hypothetical protein AWN68_13480 [Roseivirga echinicomitans]
MTSQKFRNQSRNLHRDIAYFFVGLIIAFAISGIALNHRGDFNSREFTYSAEPIKINLPADPKEINEAFVQSILPEIAIGNEYTGFRVQGGTLRIIYEKARAEINIKTGEGEKEWVGRRIGLAEMADLHQSTNKSWIWYSDIFGIAMILIAVSGMFVSGGETSFRKRGWKFAIVGIAFPLVFLFFLI